MINCYGSVNRENFYGFVLMEKVVLLVIEKKDRD